jgi:DNA-binding IclR family transcriptional regulator
MTFAPGGGGFVENSLTETATGTQSIHRAIAVIRLLTAAGHRGHRATDIARITGLSRPTIHRILRALVVEGLAKLNEATHRYMATAHASPFTPGIQFDHWPLLQATEPYLQRLAARFGDTVLLTVRMGFDAVCVARRLGANPLQVLAFEPGGRRPMGVGTAGIAMLAVLSDDQARDIAATNRERLLEHGLSVPRVLSLVRDARGSGCSLRERGLVPGTKGVSVALDSGHAAPLAALTLVGAERHMTRERLLEVAAVLKADAVAIESVLGKSCHSAD